MTKLLKVALLATALTGSATQAAVLVPGAWTSFSFGGNGSALVDSATGDAFYTFSIATPTLLKITDAFIIGDVFQLTINSLVQDPTGLSTSRASLPTTPMSPMPGLPIRMLAICSRLATTP